MDFQDISGIIVVDKPEGKTSTYVDNILKKKLKTKVGHIGTIDVFASGVLPLAISKATKFIPYIIDKDREYIAEILLGKRTITDDITGEEIYSCPPDVLKNLREEDVISVLKKFEGIIEQVPPYFSAKKYMGQPLYLWAREKGKFLELTPSKVTIYRIDIIQIQIPIVKIRVISSGGMYVRALARDVGDSLQVNGVKVGGTLKSLRRIRCSIFTESDAIPADVVKNSSPEEIKKYIKKVTPEMLDMRKIILREQDIQRIKNGAPPKVKIQGAVGEYCALCDESSNIVAIGKVKNSGVIVKRVI